MSTVKQIRAYREILHTRHQEHLIKTYGMIPLKARWPTVCGCGEHPAQKIRPGDSIVKFRGVWWSTVCVDRVKQDEFRETCRFVLEARLTGRRANEWRATAWTNDPKEAEIWKRLCAELDDDSERLTDRQEQAG